MAMQCLSRKRFLNYEYKDCPLSDCKEGTAQMAGTVLIAHQVATDRILLREFLGSSFYDVAAAANQEEALDQTHLGGIDVVIMQAGFGPAATFKQGKPPAPVVLALTDHTSQARLAALSAGADDVLSWPADARLLLTRLQCLIRQRNEEAELSEQERLQRSLGLAEAPAPFAHAARIAIVSDTPANAASRAQDMAAHTPDQITGIPWANLVHGTAALDGYDAVLLDGTDMPEQALSLIGELSSRPKAEQPALLPIFPAPNDAALSAMSMTGDDVMLYGFDPLEAAFRIDRILLRRSRQASVQRHARQNLTAAVRDPQSGLHTRGFALHHLKSLVAQDNALLSVAILDMTFRAALEKLQADLSPLTDLSDVLTPFLDTSETAARVGPSQFVLILPELGPAAARRRALLLQDALERARPDVDIRFGLATRGLGDARNEEQLLQTAIFAMRRSDDTMLLEDAINRISSESAIHLYASPDG
jgi:two-component system cell cycle response regulator